MTKRNDRFYEPPPPFESNAIGSISQNVVNVWRGSSLFPGENVHLLAIASPLPFLLTSTTAQTDLGMPQRMSKHTPLWCLQFNGVQSCFSNLPWARERQNETFRYLQCIKRLLIICTEQKCLSAYQNISNIILSFWISAPLNLARKGIYCSGHFSTFYSNYSNNNGS
jgi:hypothetical protein